MPVKAYRRSTTCVCIYCGRIFTSYILDGIFNNQYCKSINCAKQHEKEKEKRKKTKPKKAWVSKEKTAITPPSANLSVVVSDGHHNVCRVCKNSFISSKKEEICPSPACRKKDRDKRIDRIYNLLYPSPIDEETTSAPKTVVRECLRCEQPFESEGNWLCQKCTETNKQYMEW